MKNHCLPSSSALYLAAVVGPWAIRHLCAVQIQFSLYALSWHKAAVLEGQMCSAPSLWLEKDSPVAAKGARTGHQEVLMECGSSVSFMEKRVCCWSQ